MNIRERTIDTIARNVDAENAKEYLMEHDDLTQLDINSITFIKIVVDLESVFDFEFEDEELNYDHFNSLDVLIQYIKDRLDKVADDINI